MKLIKTAMICGKRWRFKWEIPPKNKHEKDYGGLCDCTTRTITIDPALPPHRLMQVVAHEIEHAIHDALDERRAKASETIADVQWRMGYRCE